MSVPSGPRRILHPQRVILIYLKKKNGNKTMTTAFVYDNQTQSIQADPAATAL